MIGTGKAERKSGVLWRDWIYELQWKRLIPAVEQAFLMISSDF